MRSEHPTTLFKAIVQAAVMIVPAALIVTGVVHLLERDFDFSLAQWVELLIAGTLAVATSVFVFARRRPLEKKAIPGIQKTPPLPPQTANRS
jgi:hypothetical protein